MKSKTSFFNQTVLKKNLTRFAPVMAVYTLCLILGMMMLYQNNEEMGRTFWFASRMGECIQVMGLVNLFFATLCAILLFGDLYNSRMCNALHAMPMRRETLFLTNVVSGLLFSMIPTAVMALLSVPLLNATIVENAWQIALLWYVGTNLQFITFFGAAIFSVFCTGNRFAMAVVYAVLNGGAFILYLYYQYPLHAHALRRGHAGQVGQPADARGGYDQRRLCGGGGFPPAVAAVLRPGKRNGGGVQR